MRKLIFAALGFSLFLGLPSEARAVPKALLAPEVKIKGNFSFNSENVRKEEIYAPEYLHLSGLNHFKYFFCNCLLIICLGNGKERSSRGHVMPSILSVEPIKHIGASPLKIWEINDDVSFGFNVEGGTLPIICYFNIESWNSTGSDKMARQANMDVRPHLLLADLPSINGHLLGGFQGEINPRQTDAPSDESEYGHQNGSQAQFGHLLLSFEIVLGLLGVWAGGYGFCEAKKSTHKADLGYGGATGVYALLSTVAIAFSLLCILGGVVGMIFF